MTTNADLDSFRRWGYLQADLDDFGRLPPLPHPEIDQAKGKEAARCRSFYCGPIGAEFMHISLPERTAWVAREMERAFSAKNEKQILERILAAETFERFLHTRYVGAKRFSLEGLAALIPLLDSILDEAANAGVHTALIGMAHRGRLTTLWSIANSPAQNIFACFEDVDPKGLFGSGDVKYHRGARGVYRTWSGKEINIHLASNPSHLEAVNPVIVGRVRAKLDRENDPAKKGILPILIHGDAAFAGQGIVAETLNMADVPGFSIGGTINIIANNLMGFTAEPIAIHSSRFASDIAKRLPIPIYHVNGERPAAVVRAGTMATQYRAQFSSEVIVDLIGYRRYGHNEGDDPTFTSPLLYQKIKNHPYLFQRYAMEIGVSEKELKELEERQLAELSSELEAARQATRQPKFFSFPGYWESFAGGPYHPSYETETRVSASDLTALTERLTSVPKGFVAHPKIAKLLELRSEMGRGERPCDWGMAESLAFASLLAKGVPVRVSGQDTRRGTFSHRHSVLVDTETGEAYCPLQHVRDGQERFQIYDTVLSEAAAVGFEYGYSREYPEALVCWEAQFGDFVNGAQIYIDQFLSAGEDKWGLLSGLVLLLPHGFEGQGPEHSSGRIERFLQLCAEDNIQVAQPSTAGQYFHLLRRQALRKWRKPLIIFTPKSMLRLPAASSPVAVLSQGKFNVILDDAENFYTAERVLLCSGKIAHDLRAERERRKEERVAIVTIEQFYPFPSDELARVLQPYSRIKQITWVQEEPANMGALSFVRPYLEQFSELGNISTVRRSSSASPATGSAKAHELEQQAILKLAFANYR